MFFPFLIEYDVLTMWVSLSSHSYGSLVFKEV